MAEGKGARRTPAAPDAALRTHLRSVLGRFATGVTVVTTWDGARPAGMTANAFTSVSLDPPLVLVSVDRRAATCERIVASGAFAVNVLSEVQESLALRFAGRHRDMADPFADVPCRRGATGAPLLDGVVAWIDCRLHATYDGGDHTLFVGRIEASEADPTRAPLLFYGGAFHHLGSYRAEEGLWAWG